MKSFDNLSSNVFSATVSRFVAVAVAITTLIFLSACAELRSGDEAADDVGKPTYFLGELRSTEVTSIEHGYRGAVATLKSLNYTIKTSDHDLLQATIVGTKDGKEVKIVLEENSPTTTEFRIRIGKMGDRAGERELLEALRRHI